MSDQVPDKPTKPLQLDDVKLKNRDAMAPRYSSSVQKLVHRRKHGTSGQVSNLEVGWNPETTEWEKGSPMFTFMSALRQGAYKRTAARLAGMSPTTIDKYVHEAMSTCFNDDGELMPLEAMETDHAVLLWHFFKSFAVTESLIEQEMVGVWTGAANQGDWRAAQTFLAARFPERWSEKQRLELTGKDGGPLAVTAAQLAVQVRSDPAALNQAQDLLDQLAPASFAELGERGHRVAADLESDVPPGD